MTMIPTYSHSKTVQELANETVQHIVGMTEGVKRKFIEDYIKQHYNPHNHKTDEEITAIAEEMSAGTQLKG
ncbi:hypothetical protein CACET_c30450 [Clostridium aceticum]|uniref:Uncharacterized protein n=1 Tax=Clostridium aceticum TaxID=84022 RepID=A0A0D8IBA9_9CLOT|nr:hypothetical protein [Clostridium aceticum]AKL96489.1 hypothetical protein CACET_c30450 [Clostridium aceticum]KJF27339.1 hypothetical protein TZ02_08360 [Clostridium aceticum]